MTLDQLTTWLTDLMRCEAETAYTDPFDDAEKATEWMYVRTVPSGVGKAIFKRLGDFAKHVTHGSLQFDVLDLGCAFLVIGREAFLDHTFLLRQDETLPKLQIILIEDETNGENNGPADAG